jgi:hypothetical protein
VRNAFGNVWELPGDLVCILTNGQIRFDGDAVMGRGQAKEAATLFPELPSLVADALLRHGNLPAYLGGFSANGRRYQLATFPTKHKWRDRASLELIEQSAFHLMRLVDANGFENVLLPHPGCGFGGLNWDVVRERLEPVFDDRIIAVDFTR